MKELFILLFSVLSFGYHPVHVSVINMDILTSKNQIEFSIRLNSQDLEYAIIHMYDKEISFSDSITGNEKVLMNNYMNSAFSLKMGGKVLALHLDTVQIREDNLWIFYHSDLNGINSGTLLISNRLLLDLFPDQTNLVIINVEGKETGYTFTNKIQETKIIL